MGGKRSMHLHTLGELKARRPRDFHSYIREHARRMYHASGRPKVCSVCGYDKRVDVCHIKDIKDFEDTALIDDINGDQNLVTLCPNHHWEFDNGYVVVESYAVKEAEVTNAHRHCRACDSPITRSSLSGLCSSCASTLRVVKQETNRPPLDVLLHDVETLGYREAGRKYGVSDNAIRKWIRLYIKWKINSFKDVKFIELDTTS